MFIYTVDEPIEEKGFTTHNTDNGVQLYEVTLQNGKKLIDVIKEINTPMKDGAQLRIVKTSVQAGRFLKFYF